MGRDLSIFVAKACMCLPVLIYCLQNPGCHCCCRVAVPNCQHDAMLVERAVDVQILLILNPPLDTDQVQAMGLLWCALQTPLLPDAKSNLNPQGSAQVQPSTRQMSCLPQLPWLSWSSPPAPP
jgi:hypothetical protein